MVSEVIFPKFWGVVCIEKCFWKFEIVVGSAVSEVSQFARFYETTVGHSKVVFRTFLLVKITQKME